jgi:spore coat protein H
MNTISRIIAVFLGGLALALNGTGMALRAATTNSETAYLADLFAGRTVLRIQIEISVEGMDDLSSRDGNNRHRPSALATVTEGGHTYTNVSIHLKGGAGSYRPIDNNPGLTLEFAKNAPGQTFHGLKKFSLNNSVQDRTFLNEKICRDLFNLAGSPAPRAGFAAVQLNGRNLGIHVLIEGANKQFLRRHFENVHGNLYQTHGNQEITGRLDVNSGDDPTNHAGLHALVQAIREEDPAIRWRRLEETLDVNRFLTFMAMEVMLWHWDGYCMNQNNYRVFQDLGANKIVFIAHGMDQMFGMGRGSADRPIHPPWRGLVAKAVMSTPQGRQLYLARLGELYTNVFRVESLLKEVDQLSSVVREVIAESNPQSALAYQRRVDALKTRIEARDESLARQLNDASKPSDPDLSEPIHLTGWTARIQNGQPEFDKSADESRANLLHISALHGKSSGSWRTRIQLEPGRYRFETEMRVRTVGEASQGIGAGLRIYGGRPIREVSASTEWRPLAYEFQVDESREVEFICELRARDAEVWFDAQKIHVVRVD